MMVECKELILFHLNTYIYIMYFDCENQWVNVVCRTFGGGMVWWDDGLVVVAVVYRQGEERLHAYDEIFVERK